jgi:F0F1-type ATP synthase membrane subunit c/vacuolar-type H+-ATPase subunit K
MNPARRFGPDLVGTTFTDYWVYALGPLLGAVIAVGLAYVLPGSGGGLASSGAAQGASRVGQRYVTTCVIGGTPRIATGPASQWRSETRSTA